MRNRLFRSSSRARTAVLAATAALAATGGGGPALAAGSGYTAAKAQWKAAPCKAAAVQGRYWLRAAKDLSRRPHHAGSAPAIRELRNLASLPDTNLTPKQMLKSKADARALNAFFHTPGDLITRLYCSP